MLEIIGFLFVIVANFIFTLVLVVAGSIGGFEMGALPKNDMWWYLPLCGICGYCWYSIFVSSPISIMVIT